MKLISKKFVLKTHILNIKYSDLIPEYLDMNK